MGQQHSLPVSFEIEGGVYTKTSTTDSGKLAAQFSTQLESVKSAIVAVRDGIHAALASSTKDAMTALSCAEAEFGITLGGEGNIILIKSSASATLKVTLTWNLDKDK